jgi:hypothetical protein
MPVSLSHGMLHPLLAGTEQAKLLLFNRSSTIRLRVRLWASLLGALGDPGAVSLDLSAAPRPPFAYAFPILLGAIPFPSPDVLRWWRVAPPDELILNSPPEALILKSQLSAACLCQTTSAAVRRDWRQPGK